MSACADQCVERAIAPRAPFDFSKSLDFLCAFPATAAEQLVDGQRLVKAMRVDGVTLIAEITSVGTVARPRLRCRLHSAGRLSPDTAERAIERLRAYLGTDDDLRELYRLAEGDRAFAAVARSLHGYHQVRFPTAFENACWAVLAQRCPIPVARKLKDRLVTAFGATLTLESAPLVAFPEPRDLDGVSAEQIAKTIGNAVKARRVRAVVDAFDRVEPAFLRNAPTTEVRTWLESIDGIGPWSATFVLVRGLGRTEAITGIEDALLPLVTRIYGRPATRTQVQRIAARYGAWQGYWAHYLRVAA